MFGISSGELFFIALIALIVLGPERLPKVTRFAGLWVRRARAQWHSVKDELERELAADELKRSLQDARDSVTDIERKMRESHAETEREFDQLRSAVKSQPVSAEVVPNPLVTDSPVESDLSAPVTPEVAELDTPQIPPDTTLAEGPSNAPRNA